MAVFDSTLLNRMLSSRVRELAKRRPPSSKESLKERVREDTPRLLKALGLWPLPAKPSLDAKSCGGWAGDGYRVEKLLYHSRQGIPVPAHLYLPVGKPPFPAVIYLPDLGWHKGTPWVQSAGIGLSLLGLACLIIDPPGAPEREALGTLTAAEQSQGVTQLGEYVWDAIRGLDLLLDRRETIGKRVGVTGCGFGGYASLMAFAVEARLLAAAPACCGASLEGATSMPEALQPLTGLSLIGDLADIAILRAPDPILFLGTADDPSQPVAAQKRTAEKYRAALKIFKAEDRSRLEIVLGPKDYNRRTREAMYGFFANHLLLHPANPYAYEPRPLTDGSQVPFETGTRPSDDSQLLCGSDPSAQLTLKYLLSSSLDAPYPETYDPAARLVSWARFGRLPTLDDEETVTLSDEPISGALSLPFGDIDQGLCAALGLSVAEFFGQLLHEALPTANEGWEKTAVSGHALTSMIASVKTLVSGGPGSGPKRVDARGPLSSLTAQFVGLLRPEIEVTASHRWQHWADLRGEGTEALLQPGAIYMEWPFGNGATPEIVTRGAE